MARLTLDETLTAAKRRMFGKRLLRLEAYLASLPAKAYNHGTYIKKLDECGTVACALGHAVASKKFRGLPIKAMGTGSDVGIRSTNGQFVGDAADTYFGPDTYNLVFSSYAYREVAKRPVVTTVRANLRKLAAKRYGVVAEVV